MRKKLLIAAVVLAAVLAALGIVAYAKPQQESVPVNWKIAGSVFNGIQVVPSPGSPAASFGLLSLSAKGSPGAARIEAVGTAAPVFPPSDDLCPGAAMQLKFEGGFVATFSDLSMLFFAIDDADDAKNALCVYPDAPNRGTWDYNVTGGTGRFEGATGHVTVRVTAWGVVPPVLAAESGDIVGTIELP
jgi:hypothetical protein